MTPAGTRVIGYIRSSTKDQAENGISHDTQRSAIEQAAAYRGWVLVDIVEEQCSGDAKRRPVRDAVVARIGAGEADALVVAKLDRLSRSLLDFAKLVKQVRLIVLDFDFDMTTAQGELMASMLMAFAQFERRLIGERTKTALAEKSRQGVRLGRPVVTTPETDRFIAGARADGLSYAAIARKLNEAGIPTSQGGARWHDSTVRNAVARLAKLDD